MNSNRFIPFLYPNTSITNSPINHVKKIICDPEGTIWFASNMNGVIGYTTHQQFVQYNRSNSNLQTNSITDLSNQGNTDLWIATSYGLYVLDIKNKKLSPFTINGKQSFAEEYIECVMEDSRGLIWIGTQNGMFRIVKSLPN